MILQAYNQYWQSLREPRNLVDIALVFLLVYALLRWSTRCCARYGGRARRRWRRG
jgi:hypothetical protein